jgi:hypothetical protein
VTDPQTSRDELKRIWRAAGGDTIGFSFVPGGVLTELEKYPAAILREAVTGEMATLRPSLGVVTWLEHTREVGEDWLTEREEFEADLDARRTQSQMSACPRCRQPLGAEVCACGFRPGWVKAQPRTLPGGERRDDRESRGEREDIEAARAAFHRRIDEEIARRRSTDRRD